MLTHVQNERNTSVLLKRLMGIMNAFATIGTYGLRLLFYAAMQLNIVQSASKINAKGTLFQCKRKHPCQLLFDFFSCWQVDSAIQEYESRMALACHRS